MSDPTPMILYVSPKQPPTSNQNYTELTNLSPTNFSTCCCWSQRRVTAILLTRVMRPISSLCFLGSHIGPRFGLAKHLTAMPTSPQTLVSRQVRVPFPATVREGTSTSTHFVVDLGQKCLQQFSKAELVMKTKGKDFLPSGIRPGCRINLWWYGIVTMGLDGLQIRYKDGTVSDAPEYLIQRYLLPTTAQDLCAICILSLESEPQVPTLEQMYFDSFHL